METKQIEMKSYKTVYVAADGTEFEDQNECMKYDQSAMGVVKGRVKKLAVKVSTEESLLGGGCCDNESWVVIPKSVEDIALIRQCMLLMGQRAEYVEKLGDDQVGRVVLLSQSYDGDYMWFQTLDKLVETITDGKFVVNEIK